MLQMRDIGNVKGFRYTEKARMVITRDYTEDEALKGAGYDPTKIWEPWTVNCMRMTLFVSWLLFFGSISISLATFELLRPES